MQDSLSLSRQTDSQTHKKTTTTNKIWNRETNKWKCFRIEVESIWINWIATGVRAFYNILDCHCFDVLGEKKWHFVAFVMQMCKFDWLTDYLNYQAPSSGALRSRLSATSDLIYYKKFVTKKKSICPNKEFASIVTLTIAFSFYDWICVLMWCLFSNLSDVISYISHIYYNFFGGRKIFFCIEKVKKIFEK